MTYQAGIQQSRTYNNTIFNAYNPYYIATLNVAVTQPLLRNAGMNATKRQLKLAFVNADATAAQALVDASNTISQVEDAYWNLVAAWRNVAIQEEALKEAIAQQRATCASRGAAPPHRSTRSSRRRRSRTLQNDVFSALQTVSQLQVQLKSLVVADPGDPIWTANLVPSTSVRAASARRRFGANYFRSAAKSSRSTSGRGQTTCRGYRPRLRCKSVAAAGRRSSAISQQRFRGHPHSRSGIFARTNVPGLSSLTTCPTPPPNTQGEMAVGVSQHVGRDTSQPSTPRSSSVIRSKAISRAACAASRARRRRRPSF